MNEVTRRDAVKFLAAGAVASAAAAVEARDSGSGPAVFSPPSPSAPYRDDSPSLAVARRSGAEVDAPLPVRDATVLHCRSWDSSVYLYVDPSTHGFVQVSAAGFAIAAACQAAGRTVAVKTWGHDPEWGSGAGRFDGAALAIDPRDLAPPAPAPSIG